MSPAANRSRRGSTPVLMRGLLVLGFALAVGAVAIAVFSDDVRLLKLAALLGVWAALATAFPVVYFRRTARTAEQKTDESKRTYEVELHREITARREYEIGISAVAQEEAETKHREELAALREQLDRLNTTLSSLLEGDLLFERMTLSAESTRVRQVGHENGRGRISGPGRPGQIENIPEPTGPYVGQQSGAPVFAGPAFVYPGRYPAREDDTVQFPRANYATDARQVAKDPVESVMVQPAVESAVVVPEVAVVPEVVVREIAVVPEEAAVPEVVVVPEVDPVPVVPAVVAVPGPEPVVVHQPEPAPAAVVGRRRAPVPVVEPEPELVAEPESELEPVPQEDAPPEHSDAGTGHSAGISVADLLAAYGANESANRRRRRAQD